MQWLKSAIVVVVVTGTALFLNALNGYTPLIQTSAAVQIPEVLIRAFEGIAIGLFTAGFVYIFEKTGLDLTEFGIPMAVSFAAWAVAEFQGYINSIPEVNDPWISLFLRVLVALVPAVGLLRLISRQPAALLQ